ncbi:putative carbohydrate esterase family 8 protein [Botrytis fragariae]|uniref:Pectinesterase n=1 Tax=Botrytis fragariae TaxID=1964551 RepID=A0A8H6B1S9_9HELO|nr:putative carbohydrate esterase family 8 protein [Botrytis fragariae]KAF5877868.1 putative carbohydrate esterase family 8 protein [Botrytis fragariae]
MATFKYIPSFLLAILLFVGSIDASAVLHKRAGRTSPPSGCLTVRGSGTLSGEYSTVAAALTALGSSTAVACIFIYSGTYNEQLTVSYGGNLTVYGYTTNTGTYKSNTVTITHGINSTTIGLDASSTVNIKSANFKAYNVNFANTYGAGVQAVAVTANGDQQGYYGCSFTGYQDTLYAKSGKQYYSNCYIEGAVDYIFGNAAAWFGECTIASNGGGAITANSRTLATDSSWYIIDSSTITQADGFSLTGKVYLGRPWRALARVIFQNSVLTDVVNAAGWTTLAADATPIFMEYANTGAGSSTSARVYETAATGTVSKTTLWGSNWASWIDSSY